MLSVLRSAILLAARAAILVIVTASVVPALIVFKLPAVATPLSRALSAIVSFAFALSAVKPIKSETRVALAIVAVTVPVVEAVKLLTLEI